jgi:hypothetical protein
MVEYYIHGQNNDFLCQSLPSTLEYLDLSGSSSEITADGIAHLPKSLKYLSLNECHGITDEARSFYLNKKVSNNSVFFQAIAKLPPLLVTLNLHEVEITEEGFKNIPKSIQHLDISSTAYCKYYLSHFQIQNAKA